MDNNERSFDDASMQRVFWTDANEASPIQEELSNIFNWDRSSHGTADNTANLPALLLVQNELEGQAPEPAEYTEESDQKDGNDKYPPRGEGVHDELVASSTKAIKSGSLSDIEKHLASAYAKWGKNGNDFDAFAYKLQQQLKDEGFDVKIGGRDKGRTINVHRHGADNAVEFFINSENGAAKVKAQSYDWVTKKDVRQEAAKVAEDFRKPASEGPKDAAALAKLYEDGKDNRDYSLAHKELLRSAAYALQMGGMEAVRELEQRVNRDVKVYGGPAFMEEKGELRVYNAIKITDVDEVARAAEDPQFRDAQNILKHPKYGYIKVLEKGPSIAIPERKTGK